MPKIRDLGISVIPTTMRPPESCGTTPNCVPSKPQCKAPSTKPKPKYGDVLADAAVAQLRQQLRSEIGI